MKLLTLVFAWMDVLNVQVEQVAVKNVKQKEIYGSLKIKQETVKNVKENTTHTCSVYTIPLSVGKPPSKLVQIYVNQAVSFVSHGQRENKPNSHQFMTVLSKSAHHLTKLTSPEWHVKRNVIWEIILASYRIVDT